MGKVDTMRATWLMSYVGQDCGLGVQRAEVVLPLSLIAANKQAREWCQREGWQLVSLSFVCNM